MKIMQEEEKEEASLTRSLNKYSHMMILLLADSPLIARRRLGTCCLTAASCSAFWLVTEALVGMILV